MVNIGFRKRPLVVSLINRLLLGFSGEIWSKKLGFQTANSPFVGTPSVLEKHNTDVLVQ